MRVTQGCFAFLPDLTDEQITGQVQYCINNGWAVNIEYADDPHPRNTYWGMWGAPMFGTPDAAAVMYALAECRTISGERYIRVSGFDSIHGWESVRISFIVTARPMSLGSTLPVRKMPPAWCATPPTPIRRSVPKAAATAAAVLAR